MSYHVFPYDEEIWDNGPKTITLYMIMDGNRKISETQNAELARELVDYLNKKEVELSKGSKHEEVPRRMD
jgi:hypothetical protein